MQKGVGLIDSRIGGQTEPKVDVQEAEKRETPGGIGDPET